MSISTDFRIGCGPDSADLRQRPADATFRSILFPAASGDMRPAITDQPACFVDLNLDQIVSAIVSKRDENVLRPIFYSTFRDEHIIRHRLAVFADLERPELFPLFPEFCDTMQSLKASLAYVEKINCKCHRDLVFLYAVSLYTQGVTILLERLQAAALHSDGLKDLRAYLADYARSPAFTSLVAETAELHTRLSRITYSTLFRGDKVTVRKYASEPDYTVTILDRFARFREGKVEAPALSRPKDSFSLNHIEEGILEFVGRLHPKEFAALADFAARHSDFIDETIARFDREIDFYLAYLALIDPLKQTGLPFCHPDVSASRKETDVCSSFDLALAIKLTREQSAIVTNDFHLRGAERLIVVSGPNQGGKTTFARMFGQLHFLAGLGCPVPGTHAKLFLADHVFTHFEREEDITNLRGKLEDELVRLHRSCESMTPDSVVVLNEIFNSTSLDDQIFLSTKILQYLIAIDAVGVCVTFIDALSTLGDKTVSMVSTVAADDPSRRTFEIVRKPADGLAYALSLADKRGVTYRQLRERIRP
jgi:hypothetical protein